MTKPDLSNLLPANLGGVKGYGRADFTESPDGYVQASGLFSYNTIDFGTLKESFMAGRRLEYRGQWLGASGEYIATVDVQITAFSPDQSALTFKATFAPKQMLKL